MHEKDDLAQALAKNGAFDADRASSMRKDAVATFQASFKRAERILRLYMCLCVWLLVFTFYHFLQSSATKSLLFYALLMLVFFETTVLMKLWYWIVNSKTSVLKEIKQLELRMAHGKGPSIEGESSGRLKGVSRGERTLWWGALVVGAMVISGVKAADLVGREDPWNSSDGGAVTSVAVVMLNKDGSATERADVSCVREGTLATRGFNFHAPKNMDVQFADNEGNKMPFASTQTQGHTRYDVRLAEPVPSGARFSYVRTMRADDVAVENSGTWSYTSDIEYGYATNHLEHTVVLPEGAEVVSTAPWPTAVFTVNNRTTVRFTATRGRNEKFRYSLEYRLPSALSGFDTGVE